MAKTETPKTNVKINFGATDKIDLTQLEDGELIALTKDPNNANKVLGTDNSGNIVLKTESGEPNAYLKSASVSGNTLTLTKKDNTTVTFTAQGGGGGGEEDTYTPTSGTKTISGNLLANAYQLNIGTPYGARSVLSMSGTKLLLGNQYLTTEQIGAGTSNIIVENQAIYFTANNYGQPASFMFPTTRTTGTEHFASQEWVLKSPNTVRIHGYDSRSAGLLSSYTVWFLDGTSTTRTSMAGGTDSWDTYNNVRAITISLSKALDFGDADHLRSTRLIGILNSAEKFNMCFGIGSQSGAQEIIGSTSSNYFYIGIVGSTDIEIQYD